MRYPFYRNNPVILRQALSDYAEAPVINTAIRRGNQYFYMVDSLSHSSPALYVQTEGEEERLLIDPANFQEVGLAEAQIADFRVSPNGECVAVIGHEASSDQRVMRIFNMQTHNYLPGKVMGVHLADQPWREECTEIVFISRSGDMAATAWIFDTKTSTQRRIVALTDQEKPRLVVNAADGGLVAVDRRKPRHYRALWIDDERPQVLGIMFEQDGGRLAFIGASGGQYFFHALDGKGGEKILAAHNTDEGFETREVLDLAGHSATAAHIYGGKIVVNGGTPDGLPMIYVHALDGELLAELEPPFGLLWTNFPAGRAAILGNPGSRYAYTASLSLHAAGVYEIDLEELTIKPWRLQQGMNPDEIIVKRVRYDSTGGVEVPMSLAYQANTPLDGSAPALVWVYGAHGFTATPFFSAFFKTFIDAGGILAFPQVRSGGVFGVEWHAGGSRANKLNTIADTVAALEWLLENKVTKPQRLAIMGNSSGTIPAIVAAIEHPDMVAAVLLELPLSDMIRHKQWLGGWTTEFGDPEIENELNAILKFSPNEKLLWRRSLPPTLIYVGENDTTALPIHAFKLTASMQYAQTEDAPVYLRMMPGAGHQLGVNKLERTRYQAEQLTFLFQYLGSD